MRLIRLPVGSGFYSANSNQYHWRPCSQVTPHAAAYSRPVLPRRGIAHPRSPEQADWPTARSPPVISRPRPSTICNCRRAIHWPRKSARPCSSACGKPAVHVGCAPHKVFPPLLNCYTAGGSFDFHIDNAVRQPKGSHERVRTDLSSTLFFSDPDEYDGGELEIQDTFGLQRACCRPVTWCCTQAPACTRSMP